MEFPFMTSTLKQYFFTLLQKCREYLVVTKPQEVPVNDAMSSVVIIQNSGHVVGSAFFEGKNKQRQFSQQMEATYRVTPRSPERLPHLMRVLFLMFWVFESVISSAQPVPIATNDSAIEQHFLSLEKHISTTAKTKPAPSINGYHSIHLLNQIFGLITSQTVKILDSSVSIISQPSTVKFLSYRNQVFDENITIASDTNTRFIFENCVFKKNVQVSGNIKIIAFRSNIFFQDFLVRPIANDSTNRKNNMYTHFEITNNIFHRQFILLEQAFIGKVVINNNFFERAEISGCIFRQPVILASNYFLSQLVLRALVREKDFYLTNCRLKSGFRLTNSNFSQNIGFLSCIIYSTRHSDFTDCLLYDDIFQRMLTFQNSRVENLRLENTGFLKDSSSLNLSEVSIKTISFVNTSMPYLIDLSQAEISENGLLDLISHDRPINNLNESLLFLATSNSKMKGNDVTYLFLDKTDLEKIRLNYERYILGSIYYDPSINKIPTYLFVENTPSSTFKISFSDSHQLASDFFFQAMPSKIEDLPPYERNWDKKITNGISHKEELYKALLNKFERENNSKSYRKLDLEYKRFQSLYVNQDFFSAVQYYINRFWWNFGYDKILIFRNTLLFFILFYLVNLTIYKRLVFKCYNIDEFTKAYQRTNNVKRSSSKKNIINALYCFIYTGYLFFAIKLDFNKLKLKNLPLAFLVIFEFLVGIICLAYIANYIISK